MRKRRTLFKPLSLLMLTVVLGCGVLILYNLFFSQLRITKSVCQVHSLNESPYDEEYAKLKTGMNTQAIHGICYRDKLPETADKVYMHEFTLTINNISMLEAQTIEARISPTGKDILLMQPTKEVTCPALGSTQMTVILICEYEQPEAHEITFSYYLCGQKQEVKYKYVP